MVITLGQQYNVGDKPTVILYTYINRHAEPPNITKHVPSNHTTIWGLGSKVNCRGERPIVVLYKYYCYM